MLPPDGFSTFYFILIVAFTTAVMALYFLPTIASCILRQKQCAEVFAVNCLLGWTGLGWLTAIFMTANEQAENSPPARTAGPPSRRPVATEGRTNQATRRQSPVGRPNTAVATGDRPLNRPSAAPAFVLRS